MQQVKIENLIENIKLSAKISVTVGLIVNEAATNAIKHGFVRGEPAHFTVGMQFDTAAAMYTLTLSNSGNPFPDDIDVLHPKTFGFQLISTLVEQLKGTMDLHRTPVTELIIRFPSRA